MSTRPKITVKPEHIAKGGHCSTNCPVHHALLDDPRFEGAHVTVYANLIFINEYGYHMPGDFVERLSEYDWTGKMEPFTFTLPEPKEKR